MKDLPHQFPLNVWQNALNFADNDDKNLGKVLPDSDEFYCYFTVIHNSSNKTETNVIKK